MVGGGEDGRFDFKIRFDWLIGFWSVTDRQEKEREKNNLLSMRSR